MTEQKTTIPEISSKDIGNFNNILSDKGYYDIKEYKKHFLKYFDKYLKQSYKDFENYFSDSDSVSDSASDSVSDSYKGSVGSSVNDYIQNNLNNVILGDCLIEMKKIKESTVDIIICDPPYNIGKDFGNNKTYDDINVYLKWCDEWITECFRVLKPNGTMYIYGFSETLAYIRTIIKYDVKWLVWHYTNKTVPSKKFWQISHER